jgi:hypothetical protein
MLTYIAGIGAIICLVLYMVRRRSRLGSRDDE